MQLPTMKEVPVRGILQTNGTRNWFENLTTGAGQGHLCNFVRFFHTETRFNTHYGWSPPHPLSHWHNCSTHSFIREDDMPAIQSSFHFSQEFNFAEYSRIIAITVYCSQWVSALLRGLERLACSPGSSQCACPSLPPSMCPTLSSSASPRML